jgi:arsenical pump membrane protein
MGLSAAAQMSGAFAWMTDVLLQRAGGSRRRLFVFLFIAAALITIVLSNDATAIVLTPIVYHAVAKRGGDASPFLFACAFVANVASFGLPFSNPANILILPHAHLLSYLWHLGPPQLVAIAIALVLFLFFFRRELRGRYDCVVAGTPDARALRTIVVMAGVAITYLIGLLFGWPLGLVAIVGAVAALVVARATIDRIAERFAWKTLLLLAGLFVLFEALMRAGFVDDALGALQRVAVYGSFAVETACAGGAALLSNLFNNLPVAVASSYLVQRAPAEHLAYALIAGVDLGPNLAVTGSLATILWLTILRGYGVRIDLIQYSRLGALVVPPTLAVTILWLWLVR